MSKALDFDRDGSQWPHRAASRFVHAGGLRWHVQQMGEGPVALLIHGTGAATHSWRDLMPALARRFSVVAMDLPGHGFTDMPASGGQTLPGMAALVEILVETLGLKPELIVGHSAGAAIAVRGTLDGRLTPRLIYALNGAFLPFKGVAGHLFPSMAKLLVLNPFVPRFVAWGASEKASVERLIHGTGSKIDAEGEALYHLLFRNARHVSGVLGMMANWDLHELEHDIGGLTTPLVLATGTLDGMIPPADAYTVRAVVPAAEVVRVAGRGHLMHEEAPGEIAALIEAAFARVAAAVAA